MRHPGEYSDQLKVAFKNIFRNRLRSLLTVLGVAVGITAFVSLTSLGDGFKNQLEGIIKNYNIDITVTSRGAPTMTGSMIPLSDYQALGKLRHVGNVISLVIGPTETSWSPYFMLFGISSVEGFLNRLGIVEGRVFHPGRRELLLGERAARRFGLGIHDKVLLGQEETYDVVGIYVSTSRIIDGAAVLDVQDAQRLLRRYDSVNMAFLQLAPGSDPEKVVETINREFKNLTASRSGEFVSHLKLIKTVNVFTWAITLISFVTCCIVVMNTFLMAVSERTKEIGILMAIGWGQSMVMKTVISEALILCLIGGGVGNLISLFELRLFDLLNPAGLGWLIPVSLSWEICAESIGLSLLLGIAGSLYPALRAARLLPAEALRHE